MADISSGVSNGFAAKPNSGSLAITSKTASDTLSSYSVDKSGEPTLKEAVAANTGAGPIDMALSNNSHFLYVLQNGAHTVGAYMIDNRGNLTHIDDFGTLPMGSQGIAAK